MNSDGARFDPEQPSPAEPETVWVSPCFPDWPADEPREAAELPDEGSFDAPRCELPEDGLSLPHPGFWAAGGWCLLVLLAPFLVGVGAAASQSAARGGRGAEPSATLVMSWALVSSAAMLLIVGAHFKSRVRRILAIRGIGALHLALVLLLVLPVLVLSDEIAIRVGQGFTALFGAAPPSAGAPDVSFRLFDQGFQALLGLPWPLLLTVGCLLPVVVEEVFFRGFLGRGLVARFGPVWGVLLTALLFALSHVDPVQVAYTLPMGVLLHVVFLTTRSLLGPIVLHTLVNTLTLSRAKLEVQGAVQLVGPSGEFELPLLLVVAAAAAAVVLGWLLYQTRARWVLADGSDWSPGYVTAEVCPADGAVLKRQAVGARIAALAALPCVGFAALFVPTASGWVGDEAAAHVRRAQECTGRGEYDQAVAAAVEAIRLDPHRAAAYVARGEAHRMKGRYADSLADCETAIQLAPNSAEAHANRGETYRLLGDHGRALADCDTAVQLGPRLAWAYSVRGSVREDRKEYTHAVADYEQSVRLDPRHAWTLARLAWLRAGSPDATLRDGQRAVTLARQACELTKWREADSVGALAAGYAERAEYENAVRWQKEAHRLTCGPQKEFAKALVEQYRDRRPFRLEE